MNPLELRLRNYRTFENVDVELPSGCAAIIGANGAGKSSLVNAVDLALFGPDGRSWAPYLTQGANGNALELELAFEHAGERYCVRRGYSAAGNGKTTLDLERIASIDLREHGEAAVLARHADDPRVAWQSLTRETQAATQAYLEEILGLTRETFRASAFLAQGDGAAFTEAKPADRKRVLSKVLGLERFDRGYLDLVKQDRNEAKAQADRLAGALARADEELAAKSNLEQGLAVTLQIAGDAEKALGQAQAELEAAAVKVQEIEQARAARAEAQAAVAAATAVLEPMEQRSRDAIEADRDLGIANDEVATLTTLEQRVALDQRLAELELAMESYRQAAAAHTDARRTHETHQVQRGAILRQASDFNERAARKREEAAQLEAHTGEGAVCKQCEQTLGAEARQSSIANLRVEADELDAAAKDLDAQAAAIELPAIPAEPEPPFEVEQQITDVKLRLAKARADELQRERLNGRIQVLQERVNACPKVADLEQARQAVQEAVNAVRALPAAPAEAELRDLHTVALTARARVEEERIRLDAANADKVRRETELERLAELERTTATERFERGRLLKRLDRLAVLERAYGRDGIPALIIGSAAIPAIETEAVRILQELGGATASARIELRTEKANKDGTVADALDVVVVTDRGERSYETFSGGERTRLNLALRIALARLLATRRGAESRILAIDEPEFLDDAGTAALARVLQGLAGDFERIYLISHVPDLRASFDQTLEIVKGEDGVSRIAA